MGGFMESLDHSDIQEWFPYCLDFSFLEDALIFSYDPLKNTSDSPLSEDPEVANQLDEMSIFADQRHRFFAGSLKAELDEVYKFFDSEVQKVLLGLRELEDEASEIRACKKVPPQEAEGAAAAAAAAGAGGGDPGGAACAAAAAAALLGEEDPYAVARVKAGALALHRRCERLLRFKMANHAAARRLVRAQARACRETAHPRLAEQELTLALLAHPLFAGGDTPLRGAAEGLERLYAALFAAGDLQVARQALALRAAAAAGAGGGGGGGGARGLGLRLGAAGALGLWCLWDALVDPALGRDAWRDPAFRLYRGLGNAVLLVWTWGVNVAIWRRYGVDYARILELDPRVHRRADPCAAIWRAGAELSLAWLASFVCFYKALRGVFLRGVPPAAAHLFPLLLLLYMAQRMVFPWRERRSMWVNIYNTVAAPCAQVHFKEGYVGDVLTSTVRLLVDVAFGTLWFLAGVRGWLTADRLDLVAGGNFIEGLWLFQKFIVPALMAGPLYWRFMQNIHRAWATGDRWPHLGNAMKYAAAQTVGLLGVFHPELRQHPAWVSGFVFATCYQYAWDIFMDWDLLRWNGSSFELRKNRLYSSKSFYLAIAAVNLVLRFLWTITLIPESTQHLFTEKFDINVHLSPFIAAAEICRRSMWGFLRVENEHLHVHGGRRPKPPSAVAAAAPGATSIAGPPVDPLPKNKAGDGFRPMGIAIAAGGGGDKKKGGHPHREEDGGEGEDEEEGLLANIDLGITPKISACCSRGGRLHRLREALLLGAAWRMYRRDPRLFLELAALSAGIVAVSYATSLDF